jgi:hypothetical protein
MTAHGFPAEVINRDRPDEPNIIEGQNVWAHQIKDQEHLCGPATNPPNGAEILNQFLIVHRMPNIGLHTPMVEVVRKIADVFHLTG